MKLSNGIKNVLIKKLSEALELKMSISDFNEAFLFLDKCNNVFKIVPYGIFENKENLEMLNKTDAGKVFYKWLNKNTCRIEKDFNKSRKLVRVFKDMVLAYGESLAFNLSVNSIFVTSLTSLFVDFDSNFNPFNLIVEDEERLNKSIHMLRQYMAAIMFINLVSDPLVIENLISLFINGKLETLIEDVIAMGVVYNENWNE